MDEGVDPVGPVMGLARNIRSKATACRTGLDGPLRWLPVGLVLIVVACSTGANSTAVDGASAGKSVVAVPETEERAALRTPVERPPKVNTGISSVPISSVFFDTFRGGFEPLSEASDGLIEALRDAIKPVYEPRYETVEGGDWLDDDDRVIGYLAGDQAYAYPLRILNVHELVNDIINGEPVLVTYCPLCASGVVSSRRQGDQVLLFGNTSALYQSDLVMYDHETGSYWHQVIGEAIVGSLTGSRLAPLPSNTTTWRQWKELHPETFVLSRNLRLIRGARVEDAYGRDSFAGYDQQINRGRFAFPVDEDRLDDRLRPGDRVLAIRVGESEKAYLLTGRADQAINDTVGGAEVVVIVRREGPSGFGFLRSVDGRTFTFTMAQGVVEDEETGSRWDDAGRSISGPMTGARLTPVPSRATFWFALAVSVPGLELHGP